MKKNLTVYKGNQIIEAGYKLSLNEQRVILSCIAQIRSQESLCVNDDFELSATDFSLLFSVSKDRAYHSLIEVSDSLFNRYIIIDNPYPHKPKIKSLKTRWISSIKSLPGEGKLILNFSNDILPFLCELKGRFTKYELKNVGNMTSIYGIRLYELIMQWQNVGTRTVELTWLKKQFQIENSYSDITDFKKRVLKPAIDDINKHSNFNIQWTQIKNGRTISHLVFSFKEKQQSTDLSVKIRNRDTSKNNKEHSTVDNVEYFASMRQKFGDLLPIDAVPPEMIEKLKADGRW